MEEKNLYTQDEVLEIVRQVLYYGTPEYYEQGGLHGNINFPPGGTYKKAKNYFEKYYLKKAITEQ